MRCCSAADRFRRYFFTMLVGLVLAASAHAGKIESTEATVQANNDVYALSAEFSIDLGERLEEAVTHGVPLYFTLEVVLERPRQYWIAEHIATRILSYKLSYSSLTRQYRVKGGALSQSFLSLDDALRLIGRVGALPVAEKSAITVGETYQAAVRLSLDRSQLPKPFQIDALTNSDWQVEAKTFRWQFVAGESR